MGTFPQRLASGPATPNVVNSFFAPTTARNLIQKLESEHVMTLARDSRKSEIVTLAFRERRGDERGLSSENFLAVMNPRHWNRNEREREKKMHFRHSLSPMLIQTWFRKRSGVTWRKKKWKWCVPGLAFLKIVFNAEEKWCLRRDAGHLRWKPPTAAAVLATRGALPFPGD